MTTNGLGRWSTISQVRNNDSAWSYGGAMLISPEEGL
jgi:hypothetical protein